MPNESECFLKLKVIPSITSDCIGEEDIILRDIQPFDFAAPEA